MPTVKLYDELPYSTDFIANISSIERISEEPYKYKLILNQTLFFPEAGGQTCDKGNITINDIVFAVEDVTISPDNVITHIISSQTPVNDVLIKKAEKVVGSVDWEHRFSNMQQHTGEHIFSGLVYSKYGFNNVGFHLSDNTVTMDFDGFLDRSAVNVLENEVNRVIMENTDIRCSYPTEDELSKINYRCKKEIASPIRIVNIKGADTCACCCPHLHKTGEVGVFKVLSSIRYKGGTRIGFLCGTRAISYFKALLDDISEVSQILSAKMSDIVPAVKKVLQERELLKEKSLYYLKELLETKMSDFKKKTRSIIFIKDTYIEMKDIKKALMGIAKENKGIFGVFQGNDDLGYNYLVASKGHDLVSLQTTLKKELQAKGGGKELMIQGYIKKKKCAVETVLQKFF